MAQPTDTDFDSLWSYGNPEETEEKFRARLAAGGLSKSHELQLLTQIARAQGLQRTFDDAHATLDAVRARLGAEGDAVARVRYLLERGRVFNSSGKKAEARRLFNDAALVAQQNRLDFYAIDVMHMIAIVEPNPATQLEWNFRAMQLAEVSKDERARGWLGSLYNNIGWTYFEQKRFDEALAVFQKALAFREAAGKADPIRIAHYSIAKTLRAMGRVDEALKILNTLEPDGYICEELGECHFALDQIDESKPHFHRAYDLLSKDEWLQANEPERLERIRSLGEAW